MAVKLGLRSPSPAVTFILFDFWLCLSLSVYVRLLNSLFVSTSFVWFQFVVEYCYRRRYLGFFCWRDDIIRFCTGCDLHCHKTFRWIEYTQSLTYSLMLNWFDKRNWRQWVPASTTNPVRDREVCDSDLSIDLLLIVVVTSQTTA